MSAVLTQWAHHEQASTRHIVLPDGCQDVIGCKNADGGWFWFISDLMDAANTVDIELNTEYYGFRLRPGARIERQELSKAMNAQLSPQQMLAWVDKCTAIHDDAQDLLNTLARASRVQTAAQGLGVSTRTLERHVKRLTQRSPSYWLQLANVRATAQRMIEVCQFNTNASIADIAYQGGYADQSHFIHRCKQWFGHTPKQIMADANLQATLLETGYN